MNMEIEISPWITVEPKDIVFKVRNNLFCAIHLIQGLCTDNTACKDSKC